MMSRTQYKGSLLIEMLVVMALIALFLPLLVTALARLQDRHALAQIYQDQFEIKAAVEAHFQAQWARLQPAGCALDNNAFLTIESGQSPPSRLSSRTVSSQSDWLRGIDYGLCRRSLFIDENPTEVRLDCHWDEGDTVRFAGCDGVYYGQVTKVNSRGDKSTIVFNNDAVRGQSGILASQDGFYWYLSPGKDGSDALWRTPDLSGNSQELMNGIERLAVLPLLDETDNGLVDALATDYGQYPLVKVRALWVEYQYRLNNCRDDLSDLGAQEYASMRGEVWRYSPPCQGIGNQIISL
ncbi:hypothetical protein J9B83_08450 [Marinomonas sp. A79]|uniref:Uncharacterized protein n=1 Tax=Marinomonas vulgaris TaxID=2823372 RepID=A0ABS5HBZ7_9GAMM|nr:hypothetical protein [Marinomonas vulgaris]MBR7888977.1 hypothetical protein [Marinomonas vulgaris]